MTSEYHLAQWRDWYDINSFETQAERQAAWDVAYSPSFIGLSISPNPSPVDPPITIRRDTDTDPENYVGGPLTSQ